MASMARAADDLRQGDQQGTIGVRVTLFADLRRFLPPGVDGPHRRTVPSGSTVADLLAAIGVPEDADITVGVDGELADRATALRDGADVMLLSPMEGGSAPEPIPASCRDLSSTLFLLKEAR
jgi:sulfur carrier protein ThiS